MSMKAVPWGGDPLFIAMRAGNPSQIFGQANDYGSLFHQQYLAMKGTGAGLDLEKQAIVTCFEAEGTKKIALRTLLKDVLLLSLCKAVSNKQIKQMQWGQGFADLCYKHQVRLVNYPLGVKAIGTPGGITCVSHFPVRKIKGVLEKYVSFWKQEAKQSKGNDGADDGEEDTPIFEEDLLRFIPWNQEEKDRTLGDQAEIGILEQEVRGEEDALTKVFHSVAFITQAVAMKVELNLPEEPEDEVQGEGSDNDKESDSESKKVKWLRGAKEGSKDQARRKTRAKLKTYVDVDSDAETEQHTKHHDGTNDGLDGDWENDSGTDTEARKVTKKQGKRKADTDVESTAEEVPKKRKGKVTKKEGKVRADTDVESTAEEVSKKRKGNTDAQSTTKQVTKTRKGNTNSESTVTQVVKKRKGNTDAESTVTHVGKKRKGNTDEEAKATAQPVKQVTKKQGKRKADTGSTGKAKKQDRAGDIEVSGKVTDTSKRKCNT